jgi:hypothetical protein
MTTMRVTSNCSQEGGKGRWWSTWGSQPKGLWIVVNIKNARLRPPRSKSQQPKGLLVIVKEKEDNDQHKDFEQEGHK